jgi:proteasome lid subunit RPN8/RPN11
MSQAILAASAAIPREVVGFLVGAGLESDAVEASEFVELRNRSPLPHHFDVDPKSQFAAERLIQRAGLERLAILHSHPDGGVTLSADDVEFARRRRELQVVLALGPRSPTRIAAYRVDRDRSVTPVRLAVEW